MTRSSSCPPFQPTMRTRLLCWVQPSQPTVLLSSRQAATRPYACGSWTTRHRMLHSRLASTTPPSRASPTSPSSNIVVSGGWDRKLKFWDCRQPQPVAVLDLPERVYSMDVRGNLLVVGTADRQIISYDVSGQPREHSVERSRRSSIRREWWPPFRTVQDLPSVVSKAASVFTTFRRFLERRASSSSAIARTTMSSASMTSASTISTARLLLWEATA